MYALLCDRVEALALAQVAAGYESPDGEPIDPQNVLDAFDARLAAGARSGGVERESNYDLLVAIGLREVS